MAPNGIKEQFFSLFFIAGNTQSFHGKLFMGFRKAKSTQRNTNFQKNLGVNNQLPGHHPQVLKGQCRNISMIFLRFLREQKMAVAHASVTDIRPESFVGRANSLAAYACALATDSAVDWGS